MIVHESTTNESFIKMRDLLRNNGVKNCDFHMKLVNEKLANVDPLNVTDVEIGRMILDEIQINPFYYLREIFRMPSESGGMSPFTLDIASLTCLYLTSMGFSIYREQSRQTGKTTGESGALNINFAVRCQNADIGIFNYDDVAARENLQRVLDYCSYMPKYLQLHKVRAKDNADNTTDFDEVDEFGKTVKVAVNSLLNNRIVAKTVGTTAATGNKAGKGYSFSIEMFDEVAVYPNLEMVLGAAIPAWGTASKLAKKGGFPAYIVMTSTPPDVDSAQGAFLHKLIKMDALKFEPYMFDCTKEEIKNLQRNHAKNNYIYVTYGYRELGFDDDWALERLRDMGSQWLFERDILLKWKKNLKDSPYEPHHLEQLDDMTSKVDYIPIPIKFDAKDPIWSGFGGENNMEIFNAMNKLQGMMLQIVVYPEEGKSLQETLAKFKVEKLSIGSDVSGGYGGERDSSTLCGSDVVTGDTIFEFHSNLLDPVVFALVIYYIIKTYFPTSLLVIERNSYGEAVISKIKYTDVEPNLYYTLPSPDMLKKGVEVNKKGKFMYGIFNVQQIRNILFDVILKNIVENVKRIVKSRRIYEEVSSLILDRNGRVDHKPGRHDDLTVAKLLSLFPLLYDELLRYEFGIDKLKLIHDSTKKLIDAGIYKIEDTAFKPKEKERHEILLEKLDAIEVNPHSTITTAEIAELMALDIDGSISKKIDDKLSLKSISQKTNGDIMEQLRTKSPNNNTKNIYEYNSGGYGGDFGGNFGRRPGTDDDPYR